MRNYFLLALCAINYTHMHASQMQVAQEPSRLMLAAQDQDYELVECWVMRNKEVDLRYKDGRTALMFAVAWTNINPANARRIVPFLLDNGADINACDNEDHSVLWHAIRPSFEPFVIRLLIERGADVAGIDAEKIMERYTKNVWREDLRGEILQKGKFIQTIINEYTYSRFTQDILAKLVFEGTQHEQKDIGKIICDYAYGHVPQVTDKKINLSTTSCIIN